MTDGGRAGTPGIMERHIEVSRTARYAQLGELSTTTRQLWIVCHGYRQLAGRFIRRFEGLLEHDCVVVAPEGLSRFYIETAPGRHGAEARVGASWMTRADREAEIRDYVRYLDKLADRVLARAGESPPRVVVLGFSQGVHTAARWAALGSARIDELVLWGAYLPQDLGSLEPLAGIGLHLVFGDDDPTADATLARGQDDRLAAAGLSPTRHEYAGGHRIEADVVAGIAAAFNS